MTVPPEYHDQSVMALVDLRDPEAWDAAGKSIAGWGREHVKISRLDNDHVAVQFIAGAARNLKEAS